MAFQFNYRLTALLARLMNTFLVPLRIPPFTLLSVVGLQCFRVYRYIEWTDAFGVFQEGCVYIKRFMFALQFSAQKELKAI